MMKGKLTTKRLVLAALVSIYATTVTAVAAMPATIQDTNANSNSSSKCTVYYMPSGNPLNIRGRVRPVVVPLNDNSRGKHDFDGQRTILLALAPDCPTDVFCTLNSDYSRSNPFGGGHIMEVPIISVRGVECGPLAEFVDEENGESESDEIGEGSQGESIVRQHIGEKNDLEYY